MHRNLAFPKQPLTVVGLRPTGATQPEVLDCEFQRRLSDFGKNANGSFAKAPVPAMGTKESAMNVRYLVW